jgi:hypothetical protein
MFHHQAIVLDQFSLLDAKDQKYQRETTKRRWNVMEWSRGTLLSIRTDAHVHIESETEKTLCSKSLARAGRHHPIPDSRAKFFEIQNLPRQMK